MPAFLSLGWVTRRREVGPYFRATRYGGVGCAPPPYLIFSLFPFFVLTSIQGEILPFEPIRVQHGGLGPRARALRPDESRPRVGAWAQVIPFASRPSPPVYHLVKGKGCALGAKRRPQPLTGGGPLVAPGREAPSRKETVT